MRIATDAQRVGPVAVLNAAGGMPQRHRRGR